MRSFGKKTLLDPWTLSQKNTLLNSILYPNITYEPTFVTAS